MSSVSSACSPAPCCDVLIVGSGPAGALLAWILASRGRHVIVVDRQSHPRFAIGESSTPIADSLLRQLGETYQLAPVGALSSWGRWQRAYPEIAGGKKRGFSYFFHHRDPSHWQNDRKQRLLVAASPDDESSDTQWYRPSVDAFLCEQAKQAGVAVWENTSIESLHRVGDYWQCDLQRSHGESYSINASLVIDASGQGRVLARQLGLTDWTSRLHLRTQSTYTHLAGLPRWTSVLRQEGWQTDHYPFDADDAAQHHLFDGGWLWVLRFHHGITSVGWTRPCDQKTSLLSRSSLLSEQFGLSLYPRLAAWIDRGRVHELPGRVIHSTRLQHWTGQVTGPGFVLLPTSVATLDPLHSTGLAHALSGVARIARIVLGDAGLQEVRWAEYASQVQAEIRMLDRLIATAYASMRSMEQFSAASMLYFAVAIRHEELRQQIGIELSEAIWGADQAMVRKQVSLGCQAIRRKDRKSLDRVLKELCPVPLNRDELDGLYGYTFAT